MTTANITTVLLASMVAIGCAPIGGDPGRGRGTTDAGSSTDTDPTCDTANIASQSMDITFTSNATTLASTLPNGCWTLSGTLTIDSSVTSLAKLGDLRGVTNLVAKGTQLPTFDTPNPIAVTGSIDLENNTKLTDLTNLTIPTGAGCGQPTTSVVISGNSLMTGLGGLGALQCVSGATTIQNNALLATIELNNATRFEGGLTIASNAALTSLELAGVTSVTAPTPNTPAITIKSNALLANIGAWTALDYVHGGLLVDTNAALSSLAGILTTAQAQALIIEGELQVTNNAKLTEVGEFDHLLSATTIDISNNAALDYCEARQIGCCVLDSDPQNVNSAQIAGNKNTTCSAGSSWCYAGNGNRCLNDYTGYTGSI